MKTLFAVAVTVLVVAPGAFSIGVAKDPRVPALQRRVSALEANYKSLRLSDNSTIYRIFGFCNSLVNTERNFSPEELSAEPVFDYFRGDINRQATCL
jgi:hypothetical protein